MGCDQRAATVLIYCYWHLTSVVTLSWAAYPLVRSSVNTKWVANNVNSCIKTAKKAKANSKDNEHEQEQVIFLDSFIATLAGSLYAALIFFLILFTALAVLSRILNHRWCDLVHFCFCIFLYFLFIQFLSQSVLSLRLGKCWFISFFFSYNANRTKALNNEKKKMCSKTNIC